MKTFVLFAYLSLISAAVIGWCLNIGALCHADHLTGMVVARAIGIFVPPLGAVLGWV